MDIKKLSKASYRAALMQKIDLSLHQLRQKDEGGNVILTGSKADELSEVLSLCALLVSNANLIQAYHALATKDEEARRVYREGYPRAAARIMGWSSGKKESADNFILKLYQYLDLLEQGLSKKEALLLIVEEYQLHSYDAAYKRLKEARKAEVNKLQKAGLSTEHLEGILPPDWP